MKKQIIEKSYEVSERTKSILDCKILNDSLYSAVSDIVEDLNPSEAEKVMDGEAYDMFIRMDTFLNKYLEWSVAVNLSEMANVENSKVLI